MTDLRILSPCAADWNAMTPTDGGRHCAACDKEVVDLTCLVPAQRVAEMQRIQAQVARGRHVCVRAHATHDGWLTTRRVLSNGIAAMLAMSMAGCQGDGPTTATTPTQQGTEAAPKAGQVSAPPAQRPTPPTPAPLLGSPQPDPVRMGKPVMPSPPVRMGEAVAPTPVRPTAPRVEMGDVRLAPVTPQPTEEKQLSCFAPPLMTTTETLPPPKVFVIPEQPTDKAPPVPKAQTNQEHEQPTRAQMP